MQLFIDIETTPDLRDGALQKCIDAVEPPGTYKKPESIAEWKAANADAIGKAEWSKTALDPISGGIYVIGYAFEDQQPQTLWRQPQEPEAPFLDAALRSIAAQHDRHGFARPAQWIGWNVLGFDIPFIAKRCAILGIKPELRLPIGNRYNNERVQDLMVTWAGFGKYAKQRTVAEAMGIAVTDDVDGKDLWETVLRDGVAAAAKHCASDVDVLRQIYRRMQPVFGF